MRFTILVVKFNFVITYIFLLFCRSPPMKKMTNSLSNSKPGRRCENHSLESQRTRAVTSWIDVWDCMDDDVREEAAKIEQAVLVKILNQYLITHRFCGECKIKVLKAHAIMIGKEDGDEDNGYIPELYRGIVTGDKDKHIHLATSTNLITSLITRCIPELAGQ